MVNRRQFMTSLGASALAGWSLPILNPAGILAALEATTDPTLADRPASELARDESFWSRAQQAFTVDRSLINFNNGGVSPAPAMVQGAMRRHLDFSNTAPSYALWEVLEPQREGVRQRLAQTFGCDGEEIAITRNASESLQICQLGFDLRPGDEVLTTTQDYPRMVTTFRQRERREGIVLKTIDIPIPCEDPAEVVRRFRAAISERTRMILMCHVINLTGQILPVKQVVCMARERGVPVIVDGAHGFAHMAFTHADLDCDYYASSLHKWLFAPHGTGLLYVRRDRIPALWPLMAAPEKMAADIRKFEEIGTHPAANALAIGEALTFHEGLGPERKEARLRYIRDYWARRLLEHDRVELLTSLDPRFSCAIATMRITGIDTGELQQHLWKRHKIITVALQHPKVQGLRVSPSVYTTLSELDRFVEAVEAVLENGIPRD